MGSDMPPIIPGPPSNARSSGVSPPVSGLGIDEYQWLVSPAAEHWLEIAAAADEKSLVRTTLSLRKDLGTTRTHLVVAQAELRRRASVKFPNARRMFFTRQLLEQATDAQVASYKAQRWLALERVADLCCGIGGDLMALAHRGPVVGVDRDPVAVVLAAANCRLAGLAGVEVRREEVCDQNVADYAAWHMDPDRRVEGKRRTRVECHDPDLDAIERLLARNEHAAVKLAPAARLPERWIEAAELEWIGNRGECRQQMVWFQRLARQPGKRSATVFVAGATDPRTIHGDPGLDPDVAESLGRYVFEPHAAVLAADLTGVLAEQHVLQCVSPGIPYLTGDRIVTDMALTCFEVLEVLPLDPKHLREAIRQRAIGHLEVKKRGVKIDPDEVRRQINPRGDNQATLIIAPIKKKVAAILAQRVSSVWSGNRSEPEAVDVE
jgi:SAM-dependent methyltransferase